MNPCLLFCLSRCFSAQITVVNNTANVDVAGVRSFVPSGILFKNSRFIDNHVPSNGADGAIQADLRKRKPCKIAVERRER